MSSGELLWRSPLVGCEENLTRKPPPEPPSCPPSPRRANVHGTANIATGYRIHHWRHPNVRRKKTSIFDLPTPEPELSSDRIYALNLKKEQLLERKIFKAKINRRAELAMRKYEEDMARQEANRREKELEDEIKMTRKLVEKARREEEERMRKLEARAAEAELERERERQEFIRLKMLQRYLIESHELRDKRWKARTEDRKRVNLLQIEQNRKRRELAHQEELYWHELMSRYAEQGQSVERIKEEKRAETARIQAEVQLQQKAEKKLRDAQWKADWTNNPATLDVGEVRESPEKKKIQAERLCRDLAEQISESKRILEERRKQEAALDLLGSSLETSREKSAEELARDRERRYREITVYMESLKEVREAIAKRQAEVDNCVSELAARLDAEKREARRQDREDQKQLNRELSHYWDQQREHKRRQEQSEKESPSEAVDPVKLDKAERAERLQRARSYGRELVEQQEASQAERIARARADEESEARELEEIERQSRELADELARTCLRHRIPNMIP